MTIYTEIREANNILKKYLGAKVQVWIFDVSHKRLALKISLPTPSTGYPLTVYIVAITCEHITGAFSWKNGNLVINECVDNNFGEVIKLTDSSAHFELIASGGFVVAEGMEEEFGTSFDNLLGGHVE
ncbi:hypothetical protein [Taibaiella soli]|uniref:Uncharacterized protein n=1 Tax=Taibaiella soli TaxID=1649169 RepID=A0A2W2AH48_9BACT|nr:hypothetical protein [Taibaiella soli]PZF74815.1 hypothetical protein DN068_01050 [Taibaiella soli]